MGRWPPGPQGHPTGTLGHAWGLPQSHSAPTPVPRSPRLLHGQGGLQQRDAGSSRPSAQSPAREAEAYGEDGSSASVIFIHGLILSTSSTSKFPLNTNGSLLFLNAYFCFSRIILIVCMCMLRNSLGEPWQVQLSWLESRLLNRKVMGLIPSPGVRLGCGYSLLLLFPVPSPMQSPGPLVAPAVTCMWRSRQSRFFPCPQHLMCAGLWCLVEGDASCKTKLDPPLDGTECGADKVTPAPHCSPAGGHRSGFT